MTARTLLVTAGPSREFFDDVRFLSNPSTGSMGIAVAEAAAAEGWRVHLALGPTPLAPAPVESLESAAGSSHAIGEIVLHRFESARDLDGIAESVWEDVDALVATAAVCDYRPAERQSGKRKKEPGDWNIRMVRNPDVLRNRSQHKGSRTLVGFALESDPQVKEARRKLVEKQLDLIILNQPANFGRFDSSGSSEGGAGVTRGTGSSAVGDYVWVEPTRDPVEMPGRTKAQLAVEIVQFVSKFRA